MDSNKNSNQVDGVVLVDKPRGWTSHDVVAKSRGLLGTRKVGHAGTLDPDATGLLVLGVGRGTKLLAHLQGLPKRYVGWVVLGARTDSLDSTGVVVTKNDPSAVSQPEFEGVLGRFLGDILQVPPMVSAIKVGGERLYKLARQGIEVERAARPIHISSIELIEFQPGPDARGLIDVRCGSGTYIRSLAADIGEALGVGAHLDSLRRVEVGPFSVSSASQLPNLELKSLAFGSGFLPQVHLDREVAEEFSVGRRVAARLLDADVESLSAGLYQGEFFCLLEPAGDSIKPHLVIGRLG